MLRRHEAWMVLVAFFAAGVDACSPAPEGPLSRPLVVVGGVGETLGRFRLPRAIAVDQESGRFYVVDRSGRVQLFDADGKALLQWYLPESTLGQPVGIAIEAGGSVLVNDSHYSRILRYSAEGEEILGSWGSRGVGPGQFTCGRDVVVDSHGNIYAGDYGDTRDRIQKFTPAGVLVVEWGERGERPGEFQRPQGMDIERRGAEEFLLVADCANHRVQRFTLGGRFVSMFGKVGQGAGELSYPSSVVAGDDGTLYVCEWGNNRIQRFDPDGRSLGFWGSAGRGEGELATPWDIEKGPGGRLYVADHRNHRVQILRWSSEIARSPEEARESES